MSKLKIKNLDTNEFEEIPLIQGEKGDSNVLTIGEVTKGDEASATITGESPNQVLNLVLPKGDKGDTGSGADWGNIGGTITNQTDLMSQLNSKANSNDLSTVATSGSYNDLSNKPTIPDVNNMGNITVDSIEGKNLFDKKSETKNYFLNDNGILQSNSVWNTSDTIYEIQPNTQYTMSWENIDSSLATQIEIGEYTSSGSFLGTNFTNNNAGVTFKSIISKANTSYIKIAYRNDKMKNIQFEKGPATDYVPYMKYGYNSEESMGNIVVDDILPTNLIPFEAVTTTSNGVTFTANSDKSVTINGTATAQTDFTIGNVSLKAGQQYYLSGAKGGSANTWFLNIQGVGNDSGNEFIYTPAQDETRRIFIRVKNGVTVNNAICTPKLNKGSSANPFDNSESEVYSTNEIKIGRWIDGKPLYRKVIIGTCANAINTTLTLGNISNLKDVAEINANWKANDNYRYFMSNPSESPVVYINASGDVNENHKGTYFNSVSIIITIKYTKTTD